MAVAISERRTVVGESRAGRRACEPAVRNRAGPRWFAATRARSRVSAEVNGEGGRMERRVFLSAMGAAAVTAWLPGAALAGGAGRVENFLFLVGLKGGKKGRNAGFSYSAPHL